MREARRGHTKKKKRFASEITSWYGVNIVGRTDVFVCTAVSYPRVLRTSIQRVRNPIFSHSITQRRGTTTSLREHGRRLQHRTAATHITIFTRARRFTQKTAGQISKAGRSLGGGGAFPHRRPEDPARQKINQLNAYSYQQDVLYRSNLVSKTK